MSLSAAFKWFFKVLREGEPADAPVAIAAPPPPVFTPSVDPAAQLLALLQKEGRLIDFLMEDLSAFSDEEIGAAARDVHAKTRKTLQERVKLEPVLTDAEGATVTVPEGFDPSRISVSGNVTGQPPYRGALRHRGWRAAEITLPTVPPTADPRIVAPAEVEI